MILGSLKKFKKRIPEELKPREQDTRRTSGNTTRNDPFPPFLIIEAQTQNPPYKFKWIEKTIPVVEGSSETTTERYMDNYKNVSQDIRNQLDVEAEAVQIILTWIDHNDIYSIVDACPNACEM
ncbi:hypothetical protein Tco_0856740 [Tanacetum coccineum]|uniref:Uncharacterized protein n=1 Tax=Tanacetum coccineum TaxID=301880 RepID=A0ABQ5B5A2_9ASTR